MFKLEPDTFDSNRKTFLACARLAEVLLVILTLGLILLALVGLNRDTLYLLGERPIWGAFLSGYLTAGSLWWACRWSARRADD